MDVTVGDRIKDLRRDEGRRRGGGLTQQQLADEVGVHKNTVAAWEGNTQVPQGQNMVKLAGALSSTPAYILHGGAVAPAGYNGESGDAGLDLFRDWDAAMVHYAGIGPPGTAHQRKRVAWETGTAMAQHFGWDIPNWWYEIPEKIDAGEI